MKIRFLAISCLTISLVSCLGTKSHDELQQYTCSMHPQIIKNQSGECPICHMPLVLLLNQAEQHSKANSSVKDVPLKNEILSTLPTDTLQKASFTSHVDVLGKVALDTKLNGSIASNVEGRIERLYVRSVYQKVIKGQKIMEIYSPELLTAQHHLVFLLKNDASNFDLINAAKQKLLNLGMSASQLQTLLRTQIVLQHVAVYSAYTGYVKSMEMGTQNILMNENTSLLNLRAGTYVKKGETLLNVYGMGRTWALLDVYNVDAPMIKKGLEVQIVSEVQPDVMIASRVDFLEPFFREGSKTMKIRAPFDNSKWQLPIGSALKAKVFFEAKESNWLPKSAVISLGYEQVVFIKTNRGFVPRKVQTGTAYQDMVVIVSGLQMGEKVARVGQYLVDNERFVTE